MRNRVLEQRPFDGIRLRAVLAETALVGMCTALLATMWVERPRAPESPGSTQDDLPAVPISLNDASARGSQSASVALIVYTDYQCPFCAQFALTTLPRLVEQYVDTGRVRLVLMNSPIDQLHPLAARAAEAAECAGRSGSFWAMHDSLFEHQRGITEALLRDLAVHAGAESRLFTECLDRNEMQDRVNRQAAASLRLGIGGTPTSLIGRWLKDSNVVDVSSRLIGNQSIQEFRMALDQALRLQ